MGRVIGRVMGRLMGRLMGRGIGRVIEQWVTAASLAQASMAGVQQQLSALLGREVHQVRLTDEQPQRVSIIDVAMAITGKNHNDTGQDFRRMVNQYPEVKAICFIYKFNGRRQRNTPVTDARGIVEVTISKSRALVYFL